MKAVPKRLGALVLVMAAFAACKDPSAGKPQAKVVALVSDGREATGIRPSVATEYLISPDSSKVEFVGAKVTGSHSGGFNKFSGKVVIDGQNITGANVRIDIETESLFSDNEKLTTHLKSADFFDVAKFPKATFASTDIRAGGLEKATHTITGNLELHGVKKSISFPATIAIAGETVTAISEFSINRKDFGIVYPGMRENLIRDNVVIKLNINAKRAAR